MPVGFLKSNVDEINLMIYCFTSTDCRKPAAEIALFLRTLRARTNHRPEPANSLAARTSSTHGASSDVSDGSFADEWARCSALYKQGTAGCYVACATGKWAADINGVAFELTDDECNAVCDATYGRR